MNKAIKKLNEIEKAKAKKNLEREKLKRKKEKERYALELKKAKEKYNKIGGKARTKAEKEVYAKERAKLLKRVKNQRKKFGVVENREGQEVVRRIYNTENQAFKGIESIVNQYGEDNIRRKEIIFKYDGNAITQDHYQSKKINEQYYSIHADTQDFKKYFIDHLKKQEERINLKPTKTSKWIVRVTLG
jgi:hypothetical protein